MTRILLALPFLASAAFAQEDMFSSLKLGDRIQITFQSGNTLTGNLVAPPRNPDEKQDEEEKVDLVKLEALTLDISWEYPGLNGTMTIKKDQIKSIRKLRALDAETLKRLKEEKQKAMAELVQREKVRQEAATKRIKEAEQASANAAAADAAAERDKDDLKRLDELKKGLEMLTKFPPPEWGPHKLKEIQVKNLNKIPMSSQETEFVQNIELWMLGYNYRKSQEKSSEGGDPAPTPAPGGTTQQPSDN